MLFNAVYCAWKVMAAGFALKKNGSKERAVLKEALQEYDLAWQEYRSLEKNPYSATLYEDRYLWAEGLGETIQYFKQENIL